MIFETPVASEKDLLARVMAAADVGGQGLVIVCTRTCYGDIVSVLTSVVVTSSPPCKWTQTTSSRSQREQRGLWYFACRGKRTLVPMLNLFVLVLVFNKMTKRKVQY